MKMKPMITVGAALLLTAACGTNSHSSQTLSVADAQDDQRVEMGEAREISLEKDGSKIKLTITGEAADLIHDTLNSSKTRNPNGAFDCEFVADANTSVCSTVLTAEGELRQQKQSEELNQIDLTKVTKGKAVALELNSSQKVLAVSILGAPARSAYQLLAHGSSTSEGTAIETVTKGALTCKGTSAGMFVCSFDLHHSGIASAPVENVRGTIEAAVVSSVTDGLQVSVSQELPDYTRKKLFGDSALPETALQKRLLLVGVPVDTRFAPCLENLDDRALSAIDQEINPFIEFVQESLRKGDVTALYERAGAYRGRVIELLQADDAVKTCPYKKADDPEDSFQEALNYVAESAALFIVPVKIDSDVELVLMVNCTPDDSRIEFFVDQKDPVDKALENVYAQMQNFLNNPPSLKLPPTIQNQLNDTLEAIGNWRELWLGGETEQNQEPDFSELLLEFHWNQLSIPVKGTDLSGFFLWNRVQQLIREG